MEASQSCDEPELNLPEWQLKARVSRENLASRRRLSGSYVRSSREDSSRSFRSNFAISSAASSPSLHLRGIVDADEIDPSTYSFTTALKALQARSRSVWECLSPEGFALNSKWDEAERYICNPLSGEVPMECLSAKTLSGRYFRSFIAGRITMSAPLSYSRRISSAPTMGAEEEDKALGKQVWSMTRDVGTQSTPPDQSSCSLSPASTPSRQERSFKPCETEDADASKYYSIEQVSSLKFQNTEEKAGSTSELVDKHMHVAQGKKTKEEDRKGNKADDEKKQRTEQECCSCGQSGCLALGSLWMKRRQREKHKSTSTCRTIKRQVSPQAIAS